MNTEYFKNFINTKNQSRSAYQSYLLHIKQSFQKFKQQPSNINSSKLNSQLSKLKDFKELKHKDRKDIFKYCVQQNVKQLKFFRSHNNKWLAIMKATKTNLDNYQLDWKQIWDTLVSTQSQIPTTKLYTDIKDYLSLLKHLYNPDNALQVLNYFTSKYTLNQNVYLFITLFANINRKTSKQVIIQYIKKIFELYDTNQLKAGNLLVMFINACKYKYQDIPQDMYDQLNKIIIYSLTTPLSDKKDSIQNKFNTQTVNITVRILGKANKYSVQLLQKTFQLIKNFIRPFQDAKKPLRFLFKLIRGISKRIQKQQNAKTKIQKLRIKDQKKKNKLLKKQQQQKQKTQQKVNEISNSIQDNEQSAITQIDDNSQSKKQPIKNEQQQESDQENQDEEESEQQQLQKLQKMMGMQLQQDEKSTQKITQLHTKIQNLQTILKNQITPQIKNIVKIFIQSIFQDIFYVNSKKTVRKILFEIFKMYPEFIDKALKCLDKASNIPQINQEGLISNIHCIAKYIFAAQYRSSNNFLQNVIKILNKIQQNRKISDVWSIINIFIQKIPLLDEKDHQNIKQQQKTQFQSKFNQNHDKFYQNYSEIVFQCIKRLFVQSLHFDVSTSRTFDKYLLQLISNCYKHYKTRIVKLIQSQIYQNNNKFLISSLHSYIKPNKHLQQQLKQLIQNRNIDNQDNLQLDILINMVLSVNMQIQDIKKLIRKYSKRNNYKFLKQCMINLNNYSFLISPRDSKLSYLTQKSQLNIIQQPSFSLISTKLQHVHTYSLQLIDSLLQQLKQFEEKTLQSKNYKVIILQLYGNKQNTYKNMKVQKRKVINQLLQILRIIMQNLHHQLLQYNAQTNTIQYRKAPYQRTSLLLNPSFIKIINHLTYNEIFLHDQNIMNNLSLLIQNQIFFMYKQQIRSQADHLNKCRKNNRQQLYGESNFHNVNNTYIAKVNVMHLSQLNNKYINSINIQSKSLNLVNQLRLILLAPGNQKSTNINKILINKINIQSHVQLIISLLQLSVDSRFYYQRIFGLLKEITQTGYYYTSSEIINIVNYHAPLLQSQNNKIRQYSLKSFQRFVSTLNKQQVIGQVQKQCRKYISKQKHQIIWIMFVIIVVKEPLRNVEPEYYLQNIKLYLEYLTKFIMSQTRLLRRIALFTYSLCLRKIKKLVKKYQIVQCDNVQYQKVLHIHDIFQHGYIRDDHKDRDDIVNKSVLKKLTPYSEYTIKKKNHYAIYNEIQQKSFDFIINDVDLGDKILRLFHTDMAGSIQQAMAILQGKKLDLSQISFKLLQGSYVYCKLGKLNFDKIEYYFGERFFRYLFSKDAKNGYKFFEKSKSFIDELMSNFESYDNQNLIFIYTMDLMLSYQKNYCLIDKQIGKRVQQFLLKIIREIIYKGSGALFKKLLIIIQKVTKLQCLQFLSSYLKTLLDQKQKISRTTQLLTKLNMQSYRNYNELIIYCLSQKIQLNNTYILTLIQNIINLPQKYILNQVLITKYKFINLQAQLQQKYLQNYRSNFYLLNNHLFNSFLNNKLSQYMKQTQQINNKIQSRSKQEGNDDNQGLQLLKNKNQWVKIIFSIVIHATNAYIQYYQTDQTINIILQLLEVLFKLFEFKMELIIDFKLVQSLFKAIFVNKFQNIQHFQSILNVVIKNLGKLSIKRQAQIINIIAHRPSNFLFINKSSYVTFIKQILILQEHFMIYKDLIVNIGTILAYVPLKQSQITQILSSLTNKNQKILLMQCYVLSNIDIGSSFVGKILKDSGKDRRNIFCKQLLSIRGKREYLDDEQKYQQWKQIKQYSNPYHYHA